MFRTTLQRLSLIMFDVSTILLSVKLFYFRFHETFVLKSAVHAPSPISQEPSWEIVGIQFGLNTPTIIELLVLVNSIVCVLSSIMLVFLGIVHREPAAKYRVIQLVSLPSMLFFTFWIVLIESLNFGTLE